MPAGPYRIAPLLEDPFELPSDAPGKTSDGAVWVRWANVGVYSGWYAIGSRKPAFKSPSFWEKVYLLAAEVGNGTFDAVHVLGPGVLSLGGLSVTASSGMAAGLLAKCIETAPIRALECLMPLFAETGVHPRRHDASESGWALFTAAGKPLTSAIDLDWMVRRGSDSTNWAPDQKDRAKLWVTQTSLLLRDARFDAAQVAFLADSAVNLIGARGRKLLRWPEKGAHDAWQWSEEQKAIWATTMVLAFAEPELAVSLVARAYSAEYPTDALEALRALRTLAESGNVGPVYFAKRVERTVAAVPALFGVKL